MNMQQDFVKLRSRTRGFHLVTREIEEAVTGFSGITTGLSHIMILHTSAGLTLNENADPDVRRDLRGIFDRLVPENHPDYVHTLEGADDMPAHAKATLTGNSLTVPVRNGRFVLGTWQGVYLCEFRNHAGSRNLVVTTITM